MILPSDLDHKLQSMVVNLKTAGTKTNNHVVQGILARLIRSNPAAYGRYLEFKVTRDWVRSLYQRMNFSRRTATLSRPTVTINSGRDSYSVSA